MSGSLGGEATLTVAGEATAGAKPDVSLRRGDAIGRYVVLRKLGEGGMGVVYGAYDPELDRKVALKLLRPGLAGRGGTGRTRLLREAQALARLSHPNAVAILDVGTRGDEVWLAMEFVEGRTLGAWLEERPRSWREVLAVIRPVAVGLSAAHDKGLVHRDIKPDNVMLGEDGRVRVMDFGLARSSDSETQDPQPDPDRDDSGEMQPKRRALDEAVTRLGATPGTPAYMSPEQILGLRTDGRTDQFSLSVTLWEGLYGELPFVGDSLAGLATKIARGEHRPAPPGIRVPRWLVRAMKRGLAVAPEERWPSMRAFVDALDRGQRRVRMSKALAGTVVVALGGAGALYGEQLDERRHIAACEGAGAAIDEVWNDEVRERVRQGLLATEAGHAAATADKVMPWLEDQANAWREARTEVCLNTKVRELWDADTLEGSVRCLDERRLELEALVDRLMEADAKGLTHAVPAAASLRQVQPCQDAALLSRLPTPPTDAGEQVHRVRGELSEARALQATGAYEQGLEVARRSLGRAEAIGWPPLTAAARVRVGTLLDKTGKYEEAAVMQESAYFEAAEAGATEEALSAAQGLAYTEGYRLARPAEGERWLRLADVMRSALPDPAGLREAESLNVLANVRYALGAYEEAARLYERALAIRERALGREHPDVAESLNNLAFVRAVTGAYEEAARLHKRSLGIREEALGPEHPAVALSLDNLASVRKVMGAYEEAARLYERALAIRERALGREHRDVAASLNNLANVRNATGAYKEAATLHERALGIMEKSLGREHPDVAASLSNLANVRQKMGGYDEAARLHERALGIRERTLGPEHPDVATSLSNLAKVRRAMGAYDEAARLYERALGIMEKSLGHEHPNLANSLYNLAIVRRAMGAYQEAARLCERALGIMEKSLGPEHPHVTYPLVGLARVALAQGRAADAVPLAERAVKLREANDVPPSVLAKARMVLARALAETGTDRTRAVTLAKQARDAYRAGGDVDREALSEAEAWLREHGGSG